MARTDTMSARFAALGQLLPLLLSSAALAGCSPAQDALPGSDPWSGESGESGESDESGETSETTDTSETSETDEPEEPEICDLELEPIDPAIDCAAIARIVATGNELFEDHGLRRHLRLEDGEGQALGAEYGACLIVTNADCELVDVTIEPAPSQSITTLLVSPAADPSAATQLQQALTAFLAARPADERVGVFRWTQPLSQVSTPTRERGRLERLIAQGLGPDAGAPPALGGVLGVIGTALAKVQRDHVSLRELLVVADADELGDAEAFAGLRLDPVALGDSPADYEAALLEASDRLDATLAAGEQVISHCALGASPGMRVDVGHIGGAGPSLILEHVIVPGSTPDMSCEPGVGMGAPPYPARIELTMTPAQLLDYEARLAVKSKEPFAASARSSLNAEGLSVDVELQLRGQSSLNCERKSMSLDFDDDQPRRWFSGSATDEIFLISMCLDDRYVNQHTANLLMAEYGLFVPKFRMAELTINGESRGVYLLVEKPQEQLEKDNTGVLLVLRRGADTSGQPPEIKYSASTEAAALASYVAFLTTAEGLSGPALLPWLEATMDLDQYLRWIALMSLLESGDYVDEVYFMSTLATDEAGAGQDYFSVSAWDQDDIFAPCHKNGDFAMDDPHGLLYCTEARLDYAIFADPEVYARYVEVLEQAMAWLDQARFDAANDATVDALLALLADQETRAAMVELLGQNPQAIDYDVAEAEILAKASAMKAAFAARRALVAQRIDAYHQG